MCWLILGCHIFFLLSFSFILIVIPLLQRYLTYAAEKKLKSALVQTWDKGTTFLAYIHVKSRHEEEDPEIKQLKLARMHPRNWSSNLSLGSSEFNKTAGLALDNNFAKTCCKDA